MVNRQSKKNNRRDFRQKRGGDGLCVSNKKDNLNYVNLYLQIF